MSNVVKLPISPLLTEREKAAIDGFAQAGQLRIP